MERKAFKTAIYMKRVIIMRSSSNLRHIQQSPFSWNARISISCHLRSLKIIHHLCTLLMAIFVLHSLPVTGLSNGLMSYCSRPLAEELRHFIVKVQCWLFETRTDGTPKSLYWASGNVVTIVSYLQLHARSASCSSTDTVQANRVPFLESSGLGIMRSYTSAYRNGIIPQHWILFRPLDGSVLQFWIWRADRLSLFAFYEISSNYSTIH
jgi:hypothetical protein